MRAPQRHRPAPRRISPPPPGTDLAGVAAKASYVGSPEHKDAPTFAGQPKPRSDASICDRALSTRQDEITEWVREAIRLGATGGRWENGFPRYVWYKDGGIVYEGRLVNSGLGEYKGFPLNSEEWPPEIDKYYG